MNRQRGVSLSGMVLWLGGIALIAITGMKVIPSAIEYYSILKNAKAVASSVPATATVPEIRKAYDRFIEVDSIRDITSADLDITKEGGKIVISFSYEKRIPLFGNVSLLIDYSGSSAGGGFRGE